MSNNTYSIKNLSNDIIKRFVDQLKTYEIDNNNNNNVLIYKQFNYLDYLIISVYKSNSILIQLTKSANSTHLEEFIDKYCFWTNSNQNKQVKKTTNNKKSKLTNNKPDLSNLSLIGCDEVGVGEYLGPIVTCCALVSDDQIDQINRLGVKDSKLLTDDKIVSIANELRKFIKFQIFCFNPKKGALEFNQMYDQLKNINALKAYMHNAGLSLFKQKYGISNMIVLDQFVNEKKYYEHLNNYQVSPIIKIDMMEEKAESKYLSVAVASILARAYYLELCKKLLDKINYQGDYKKMLGADNKTFELIKKHIKANPGYNWKKVFKVFFKPFQEFLESLK